MTPTPAATRDIAYQLHPFTNLRKHEAEGPLVIMTIITNAEIDEVLRRFERALEETAAAQDGGGRR